MSGLSSSPYGSLDRRAEPQLPALQSELQRLTQRQFEILQQALGERPLVDRVSVGAEPIPESLLADLSLLPLPTRSELVAAAAASRQAIARLREFIELNHPDRSSYLGIEALVVYIAEATPDELEEREDVAREVVLFDVRSVGAEGRLDLSGRAISRLPDLSWLTCLAELNLSECASLTSLDNLRSPHVQFMDCSACIRLTGLEGLQQLPALQSLCLAGCVGLTQLNGLSDLPRLQCLTLTGCTGLTHINGLRNLHSLEKLILNRCTRLISLEGLQELPTLQSLELGDCTRLAHLDGLRNLPGLLRVNLSRCVNLVSIEHVQNLPVLKELILGDCSQLTDLNGLQNLRALQKLFLEGCRSLIHFDALRDLPDLEELNLKKCIRLRSLAEMVNLPNLRKIYLDEGPNLIDLDGLQNFLNLQHLHLSSLPIGHLDPLRNLSQLDTLMCEDCDHLSDLRGLQGLPALKTLRVDRCERLSSLEGLQDLPNLEFLRVGNCFGITSLDGLRNLPALKHLLFYLCSELSTIAGLHQFPSLELVHFVGCIRLTSLEGLRDLPLVRMVNFYRCTNLTHLDGARNLPSAELIDLRDCPRIAAQSSEQLRTRLPPTCRLNLNGPLSLVERLTAPQRSPDFSLSEAALDARPREFLRELGTELALRRGEQPSRWRFRLRGPDQAVHAVDMGGVKRDVTYRLVRNLFAEGPDQLPHFGEPPALRPAAAQEAEVESYRNLGRLLYIPLQFPAPVGGLFERAVLQALSTTLQDPLLLQDTAEARIQVVSPIYRDDLTRELTAQGIIELSQDKIDQLVERLEEVCLPLAREAKSLAILVRQSERSQQQRETLAYLLLRHPELGEWLETGMSDLPAPILAPLTSFLEHQDPELLDELEAGLKQARVDLEQSWKRIQASMTQIDAKGALSNLDRVKRQNLVKQLQATPKMVLSDELRIRIEGALQRQVQMEPDFSTLIIDLATGKEQGILRGLEQWTQQSPAYQEVGRAIQAMAAGIQDLWPAEGSRSELTPERLMRDLEGVNTVKELQTSCRLHPDYQEDPLATRTHAWLMRWIEESSDEDRRGFCAAITGSGALVMQPAQGEPRIRVVLTAKEPDYVPIARTCGNLLELPKTYPDYQSFKQKLELLIREGGGFSFS
jgi:Leucine-rich repeat (LRR) protein